MDTSRIVFGRRQEWPDGVLARLVYIPHFWRNPDDPFPKCLQEDQRVPKRGRIRTELFGAAQSRARNARGVREDIKPTMGDFERCGSSLILHRRGRPKTLPCPNRYTSLSQKCCRFGLPESVHLLCSKRFVVARLAFNSQMIQGFRFLRSAIERAYVNHGLNRANRGGVRV